MKSYVNYFDNIEAPDELTERVRGLTAKGRKSCVYRLAAAAAVLAVAVGAGFAWRHYRPAGTEINKTPVGDTDPNAESLPVLAEDGVYTPDIAFEDDNLLHQDDAPTTIGGYEISDGNIVTYYTLPYLNIARAETLAAMDYTLGSKRRDATEEEVEKVLGQRWREHLGIPGDAEYVNAAIFETRDGGICGFSLTASWDGGLLTIEQEVGYNVPTCCASPDDAYGHTDVNGVDVQALTWDNDASDGVDADNSCEVKFFVRGTGWKATIHGYNFIESASRFVRLGVMDKTTGLETAFGDSAEPPFPVTQPETNEYSTPAYDPDTE